MIVVTTPTGTIGSQVLANLAPRGEPIRVIVRDASRLSAKIREGVEVVEGSHGDPEVLATACKDADSVFWVVPADPTADSVTRAYLDFTRPAVDAFKTQGVGRVVGVSALGRGFRGEAGHVTASLAMDDLIAGSGVNFRALTLPSFMENFVQQVETIKNQGVFFLPIAGDRRLPTCATRDIAAVAAGLLLDHSWSGHDTVAVLGPEDLSFDDMAQVMTEVLGMPVRFEQIPAEAFKAGLAGSGMSEPMAQAMTDMMTAKNAGLDNLEPRTAEATTPTTFRQWCGEVLKPLVVG